MENVRFTGADDNITLGSNARFLGIGGDDTYIFDPNLIPANATIEIDDSEGVNTLRLPDGLGIGSSDVATLSEGGVAIQLTLSNGASVFIDRADTFDFQVGGNTGGTGSTDQTIMEFVEDTLGTTLPAAGASTSGGATTIGDGSTGSGNSQTLTDKLDNLSGTDEDDVFEGPIVQLRIPEHPVARSDDIRSGIPGYPVTLSARL